MSSFGASIKCRTCFEAIGEFYSLQDPVENRTLADILLQVTKINTTEKERLPQHLCGNCSGKLRNAYAFVQQAQRVNAHLLKILPVLTDKTASSSTSNAGTKLSAPRLDWEDPLSAVDVEIKVEDVVCAVVGDECLYDAADVVLASAAGGANSSERPKRRRIASQKAHENKKQELDEQDFNTDKDHTHLDPMSAAETHWPPDDDNGDSCHMDQNDDSDSPDSVECTELNPTVVYGTAIDESPPNEKKCHELETKNHSLKQHLHRIESTLEQQTQTLTRHTFLLERIMEKAFPADTNLNIFPLKSLHDLEATDELIVNLPEQDLFKYVKDVVGYTPISNMASRFFTDDFVLQVNWDGNHGRVPLKTFKIFTWFIFGAVKKEDFGYPQFEEAMRKCLRVAKNRLYKKTHTLKHKNIT